MPLNMQLLLLLLLPLTVWPPLAHGTVPDVGSALQRSVARSTSHTLMGGRLSPFFSCRRQRQHAEHLNGLHSELSEVYT